ncbi:peptidase M61 [Erythrobacter arachoides]|uniref:Peptidase M61 n=1 Tax=Aurantiacibacter arachoides TaxID=1850444 RepID=A0A845A4Y7_9SPHN|nr:peptidase M61 [Aurantiacibacter arachoides]MXO94482.1 peptidase M61 [Aurantiacibacter arachoides]GGD63108.1 peptidase M61 [Aurantiacibacter arachoides]
MIRTLLASAALAAALVAAVPAAAQDRDPLPPSADTPYPGTMRLHVDATDTRARTFRTTQAIPVADGARELVLVYPQWLPGNHAASGQVQRISRLAFTSDAGPVTWERVPYAPYAFRLALPAGARSVTAEMIYASPFPGGGWRTLITDAIANVQWEKMSLYPAGHDVARIMVEPSVTLPEGWTAAGALDGARVDGSTVHYAATDYETLVDSPLFAGAHHRSWDLGHNVELQAFGDEAEDIEADGEAIAAHRALVEEALLLFGGPRFDHYDFLLALTDELGDIGLEHHRSSENTQTRDDLSDFAGNAHDNTLLPHEFTHSWNGKYRRPAGLDAPDYHTALDARLLWVYEGQTSFWDFVLAARSGFMPRDMVLGYIANQAANFSMVAGRDWRSVEDTTYDPMLGYQADRPWPSLSRNRDYYREAGLVWLEADQLIRRETRGARGLDDFAATFFAGPDGEHSVNPYTFEDVVAALNAVHPHDWATFLTTRLREAGQPAPLAGIEAGGYRLVWKDEPNPWTAQARDGATGDFSGSLGMSVGSDGGVSGTLWGSPAFAAGLMPDVTIVAVDGVDFTRQTLANALTRAAEDRQPINLLVQRGERIETIALAYYDGIRYPWLERMGEGEAGLDRLLAPRTQQRPSSRR